MAAAGGMVGAGAGPAEVRSWLWVTDFGVVNLVESPVLSCGTEKHDSCDSDEQSGAESKHLMELPPSFVSVFQFQTCLVHSAGNGLRQSDGRWKSLTQEPLFQWRFLRAPGLPHSTTA